MDELVSDGVPRNDGGVEMERRRAEMHRRIMAARRSAPPPVTDEVKEPDPPRS
jgi:hypothetical protein